MFSNSWVNSYVSVLLVITTLQFIYGKKTGKIFKRPEAPPMKKGVLRNSTKFTGKHLRQNLFFSKFASLCGASKCFTKAFKAFIKPFEAPQRPATLLKKRLWYRCFPVNVVKFRTHFLQNISGGCFWVSKYYDHDCSGNIPTKEMVNVVLMKWSKNKKQNKMDSDFLCILRILSNMYDGTFCNIING